MMDVLVMSIMSTLQMSFRGEACCSLLVRGERKGEARQVSQGPSVTMLDSLLVMTSPGKIVQAKTQEYMASP